MTVPLVCLHNMVPNSHVVVHGLAIDAASGEDVVVSCQWANSCLMHTFESSQLQGKNDLNSTTENVHAFLDDQGHCTCQSVGAGVPELDIRRVEPNSDMLAIWSPVDACDGTAVIVDDQKLRRGPTGCIPQVYRVTQSNGQQVVAPSVEQVEVLVVINELWCV